MKIKQHTKMHSRKAGFVAIFMAVFVAYCGDPIPVEKMANAKDAITKAETAHAPEFAAEKYNAAVKALLDSHNKVSEGEIEDAGKKADEAKKLADEAFAASAPKLAEKNRNTAESAIAKAADLNAEEFASADYKNALDSKQKGADFEKAGDFLAAAAAYEEAARSAEKAIDTSKAQEQSIRQKISTVQDKIRQAEEAGAAETNADALASAKTNVAAAEENVNSLKYKAAIIALAKAEADADAAYKGALANKASKKYEEAKAAVSSSSASLADLKKAIEDPAVEAALKEKPEATELLAALNDSQSAAEESLSNSENAMNDKAFTDSIAHSAEAIRLAKIVEDQIPQLQVLLAEAKKKAEDLKNEKKEEEKKEPKEAEVREGWKKYTVRYIPRRRDCLWRIAGYKSIYGNPRLWPRIYKANKSKIKNPDLIYPGQVFDIPPKTGKITAPPKNTGKSSLEDSKDNKENLEDSLYNDETATDDTKNTGN